MPVKRKLFAAPVVPVACLNVEEQRLLRIPQAARYLNRSVWMVRQMIATGELRTVGKRKPFVIDRRDLDDYIDRAKAA
jgi:excisionase family DNA binding protein